MNVCFVPHFPFSISASKSASKNHHRQWLTPTLSPRKNHYQFRHTCIFGVLRTNRRSQTFSDVLTHIRRQGLSTISNTEHKNKNHSNLVDVYPTLEHTGTGTASQLKTLTDEVKQFFSQFERIKPTSSAKLRGSNESKSLAGGAKEGSHLLQLHTCGRCAMQIQNGASPAAQGISASQSKPLRPQSSTTKGWKQSQYKNVQIIYFQTPSM